MRGGARFCRRLSPGLCEKAPENRATAASAGAALYRNLNKDHTVGSREYVEYRSQCRGVRLSWESLEGIDNLTVSFTLLGLGDMGRW